jgi:stage II sporulation protein P
MKKIYLRRSKKVYFLKIITTFVLICAFYWAARLGIEGSNYLYRSDFKIVKVVDVGKFKKILDISLPFIDVTYNSGSIGNPFVTQIKKAMKMFQGFDFNSPVTILNQEASYFNFYYRENYPFLFTFDNEGEKDENLDSFNKTQDIGKNVEEIAHKNKVDNDDVSENSMISYYFYEGEEETEISKVNILSEKQIVVQNMTNLTFDIDALLKEPLNIQFDKNGPKIMVFHTHTTESFVKKIEDLDKKEVLNWSLDPMESVVSVGHELAETLRKKYGYEVIHNGTVHDYPDYDEAYNKAYTTLDNYLKSYPSLKILFDIHRDGLSKNQPKLRLTTKIEGKDVAKIMFVVGTNAKRSDHPNWRENLKLAIKLQESLNRQHPDLARHIYISNNVYNQNLSKGSLIIEIGGDGNLLSECLESVKYLAKAISEVIP